MSEISASIKRIVLVPGLLGSRCGFWPLKRLRLKQFNRIDIFKDRLAFRDPSESIERLRGLIGGLVTANQDERGTYEARDDDNRFAFQDHAGVPANSLVNSVP